MTPDCSTTTPENRSCKLHMAVQAHYLVSDSFVIFFGSALAHVRRMMKVRSSDVHSSLLKRRCRRLSRRVRCRKIPATIALEMQNRTIY